MLMYQYRTLIKTLRQWLVIYFQLSGEFFLYHNVEIYRYTIMNIVVRTVCSNIMNETSKPSLAYAFNVISV